MSDAVVAALVSGAVALVVGLATTRNSRRGQEAAAKAAVENQTLSSRTQIEEQAFTRAAGIYNETIDRQEREHAEDQAEIANLKGRVRDLETEVVDLKRGREDDHAEIDRLRRSLATATALLEQRFGE